MPPYFPLKQLEVSQFKARAQQYRAFVLFGAYTGQRSVSTIARLNVEQCREAIKTDPPCLLVKASQDKIHMEHYVPLHPAVISSLRPLFDGKRDAEPLFEYNSFQMWVKRANIPMSRLKGHFVLGDLRKFAGNMVIPSSGITQIGRIL